MQIRPPEVLSPYIKHYLFLEGGGHRHQSLRLFSDGNTGMVFFLNQGRLSINHTRNLPPSFLYGQISHYQDLASVDPTSFIIIVFQPDGLYKLLGVSAGELKNQIIPAQDVFGTPAKKLCQTLFQRSHSAEKVQALNSFFYELAIHRRSSNQTLLPAVLKYIAQHKGLVTVEQLVRYTGYTGRHIERIFAQQIGMSPKKYGNIVQLHTFLKLLRNKPAEISLTAISYESGYFDQSHLTRTFKKYTGITPSQYVNNTNKLAVNFMELKDRPDPMSGLYNLA